MGSSSSKEKEKGESPGQGGVNVSDPIAKLKELVSASKKIVFLGGAGVSTESGIPDFRSQDGLYHQEYKYPPEAIISRDFFFRKPEEFYKFYRDKVLKLDAKPNKAHLALAELERRGVLAAVITQNIDGLHQAAGSVNVFELHGSVMRNYCLGCKKQYSAQFVADAEGVPVCSSCGGMVKPDVVLYQENLDTDILSKSIAHIQRADLMIIGGTSLTVTPAANLMKFFKGKSLVIINKTKTGSDSVANLVINESIGLVLDSVL
jgi:NAD-dependent deacetylase